MITDNQTKEHTHTHTSVNLATTTKLALTTYFTCARIGRFLEYHVIYFSSVYHDNLFVCKQTGASIIKC